MVDNVAASLKDNRLELNNVYIHIYMQSNSIQLNYSSISNNEAGPDLTWRWNNTEPILEEQKVFAMIIFILFI